MALFEMGLLGLVLRFCHRLLSSATHLGLSLTWQATSPIQRGIGRGNDPRALPLSFTIPRRLPTVARFCFSPFPPSLFLLAAAAAAACCHCKEAMAQEGTSKRHGSASSGGWMQESYPLFGEETGFPLIQCPYCKRARLVERRTQQDSPLNYGRIYIKCPRNEKWVSLTLVFDFRLF
jgi:hypothetical protein